LVSVASFYQWRKKVVAGSDWPRAVEAFAPVRLVGTASVAAWLPGGTRIEIPIGDSQALQLALHTLVRADAECATVVDTQRATGFDVRRGGAAC
jgi:hypothetical protein